MHYFYTPLQIFCSLYSFQANKKTSCLLDSGRRVKKNKSKPITPCNLREITHQSSKSFVILRLFLVHLFLWPPLLESCQHFLFKLTAMWGIKYGVVGGLGAGGCSRFLLISSLGFFHQESYRVFRSCQVAGRKS